MRSSILNQHIQLPSEAESFIQSASPFWKPDESTDSCERCFKKFSFTVRRHHCRDCGGIFCSDCTPHRVQLVYRPALNGNGTQQDPKEKKRICTYCWGFIDMHQKQEHDRMNEARRMQLRAQDEGFMRRMAEGTSGVTMQCLRKHMEKELLGRNRARFGPRSVAATSTKWSNSDEDADDDNGGQDWKVSKLDHLPDSITKKNEDLCFRDNLVDTKRQWQTSLKKQQQNALKDALSGAIPKLPVPPLGLFLELSDKCGVNLTVDANSSAGQNVLAANQTSRGVEHYYHKVTDDNLMEENSLVGVAAYFRT